MVSRLTDLERSSLSPSHSLSNLGRILDSQPQFTPLHNGTINSSSPCHGTTMNILSGKGLVNYEVRGDGTSGGHWPRRFAKAGETIGQLKVFLAFRWTLGSEAEPAGSSSPGLGQLHLSSPPSVTPSPVWLPFCWLIQPT